MPHVTLEYTASLEPALDVQALCDALAAVLAEQRDASGAAIFPLGGTRVFARPARASAVADADPAHAFLYVGVRIAPGRPASAVQRAGEAMAGVVERAVEPLLAARTLGWTLQIDEQ